MENKADKKMDGPEISQTDSKLLTTTGDDFLKTWVGKGVFVKLDGYEDFNGGLLWVDDKTIGLKRETVFVINRSQIIYMRLTTYENELRLKKEGWI